MHDAVILKNVLGLMWKKWWVKQNNFLDVTTLLGASTFKMLNALLCK